MREQRLPRELVRDFMVKSPVSLETWQPVAHARQLMLMHSFSFLPVFLGSWKLLSEAGMARYVRSGGNWAQLLAATIEHASRHGLKLIDAGLLSLMTTFASYLLTATPMNRTRFGSYKMRTRGFAVCFLPLS